LTHKFFDSHQASRQQPIDTCIVVKLVDLGQKSIELIDEFFDFKLRKTREI
jgi:hypothetical protein